MSDKRLVTQTVKDTFSFESVRVLTVKLNVSKGDFFI